MGAQGSTGRASVLQQAILYTSNGVDTPVASVFIYCSARPRRRPTWQRSPGTDVQSSAGRRQARSQQRDSEATRHDSSKGKIPKQK